MNRKMILDQIASLQEKITDLEDKIKDAYNELELCPPYQIPVKFDGICDIVDADGNVVAMIHRKNSKVRELGKYLERLMNLYPHLKQIMDKIDEAYKDEDIDLPISVSNAIIAYKHARD